MLRRIANNMSDIAIISLTVLITLSTIAVLVGIGVMFIELVQFGGCYVG